MSNNEHNKKAEEYIRTKQFNQNLEEQKHVFDTLYNQLYNKRRCDMGPFTDWDGFLFHYAHVRAGLSSLLKNPDTKDDPDLIALCDLWRAQRFGSIDTNQLEELYNALNQKPVFRNNSIFVDLYGAFVKSVYELFYGEYYTQHFFDIDE